MTGPEGNSEFCFLRISMFPEMKSRETLRFKGNKIHCSPRDRPLSDLLYSKTKANFEKCDEISATTSGYFWSRAVKVNILRITVNCFPFDVIVFAKLPAHGIWLETVSLLDVTRDHELANEWTRECQLYNKQELLSTRTSIIYTCLDSSLLTGILRILINQSIKLYLMRVTLDSLKLINS